MSYTLNVHNVILQIYFNSKTIVLKSLSSKSEASGFDVWWYLILALTYISLMTNDAKHIVLIYATYNFWGLVISSNIFQVFIGLQILSPSLCLSSHGLHNTIQKSDVHFIVFLFYLSPDHPFFISKRYLPNPKWNRFSVFF